MDGVLYKNTTVETRIVAGLFFFSSALMVLTNHWLVLTLPETNSLLLKMMGRPGLAARWLLLFSFLGGGGGWGTDAGRV